jgi:tRNA(adenine34) deaminase
MCAGAILNARIPTVVYAAREEKTGSLGSVVDLFSENYGFHPRVYGGVLREECAEVLRRFFEEKR